VIVFEVAQQREHTTALSLEVELNVPELLLKLWILHFILIHFSQQSAQHRTHLEDILQRFENLRQRQEALFDD